MKETQKHIPDIVQEIQIPFEKKTKYEGSLLISPGHKLFEYEVEKQILRHAKMKPVAAIFGSKKHTQKKVIVRLGLQYVYALNWKNALKKVRRLYPEHKPQYEKP